MDNPKEDHNEREFKHLIRRILDLLEKSSKVREASYKWSTTLSIMDLLKIFSEATIASELNPPARIEKQSMLQKLDLLNNFSKIREAPV